MTAKSVQTEIENLNIYRMQMAQDIHDLKNDVKEIKNFLMGEEPKIVTKHEFEAYKSSQSLGRVITAIFTAVVTAFVTFEIMRILTK